MIFVALNEAADAGELWLDRGGLMRFHRRRDGVTVIREIIVLPLFRRRGIGRGLVARLLATEPIVRARCPAKYEAANKFWLAMGFRLTTPNAGLNTYEWHRT